MDNNNTTFTAKDFKKGQPRWCPGCGDHFFLASLHKAMAELGIAPWQTAVISGIGCSSRLPYYMNTYAMQTIHGRAAAISTGAKVANPALTVWQISGDGDGLAIGGNHFIHAVRRNIDINMILLNNRIYGLTKGPDQGTIFAHVAPRVCQQVIALRHGGRPLPSGRAVLRRTRTLLCPRRGHGRTRYGGYPEGRRPAQGRLGVRNPPELRHLQQRHARLCI